METTKQFLDAAEFLHILDPSATEFTYQILDDLKPRRKNFSKIINGPLAKCWPELRWYNQRKAGIHITLQETDLRGRKLSNIKNVRTVFADNDNKIKINSLPLKPTMIVQSSRDNSHLYYLLQNKLSTANGHHGNFKQIMQRMIELGSDKSAKDLTHTLRMPGFLNWKYPKPFPTRIQHVETDFLDNPIKYEWDQLVESFKPMNEFTEADIKELFNSSKKIIPAPFQIARIASALHFVDPSCEYDDWFRIGAALHHACQGSEQGYDLFQHWSQGSSNYQEKDWPDQWRRFAPENQDNPITVGTLYYIAREHGWNNGYSMDAPDIEDLIRKERENCFEHMNQYFGLIPVKDGVKVICQRRNELDFYGYELMSESGAKLYFAPRKIPFIKYKRNEPYISQEPIFQKWAEWDKRRFYEGFTFKPSADIHMPEDAKLLEDGKRYNTYIGLTDEGIEGDWSFVGNHILDVWCKGVKERYDYVLNWLARMYQYPGKPAETFIILTSRPGAGKSIVLTEIKDSFGRFGKTDKPGQDVSSEFNAILMDAVFILISESAFDSTLTQRAMMKNLATEPTIAATKKFEDTREVRNCAHLICLSNEEKPIRLDVGDRRYYILKCDNRYVGNFNYFAEFKRKIKEENLMKKFIHYLRNRDISDFRPQVLPALEKGLKSSLIIKDPTAVLDFIRLSLEMDNFFFPIDPKKEAGYGLDSENHIPVERLHIAYETYCLDQQSKNHRVKIVSQIAFGRKLKEIFPNDFNKKRLSTKDENGKRPSFYVIGDLNSLRHAFDMYIGSPHDWEENEEEINMEEIEENEELDFLN